MHHMDVVNMLGYSSEHIFLGFDDRIFKQTIGIFMRTNYAPGLVEWFIDVWVGFVSDEGLPKEYKNTMSNN